LDKTAAANIVGYRFVAECNVSLIRRGQERPLPFDDVPLVIRPAAVWLKEAPAA